MEYGTGQVHNYRRTHFTNRCRLHDHKTRGKVNIDLVNSGLVNSDLVNTPG